MESKVQFGKWQATAILINALCTQVFLSFPRHISNKVGTSGWMLILAAFLISFLGFWIIIRLYKNFAGKDILDIADEFGGKISKILVGSLVLGFIIFLISITLRQYTEYIKLIILPVSPISFVTILFIVVMIFGAYFGIESLARFHVAVVPVIIVGFILILVGVSEYFSLDNLHPLLGNGAGAIIKNSLPAVSIYSPILFLFMIIPFIKEGECLKKSGYMGIFWATVCMVLSCVFYTGVVMYPNSSEYTLPFYHLSRLIDHGRFFQRIEAGFVFIWVAAAMLFLSTGLFLAAYIFKKMFDLEYYKPLIIPFAILILTMSLIPNSVMSATDVELAYIGTYGGVFAFGITMVVLGVASLVKMRKCKAEDKA